MTLTPSSKNMLGWVTAKTSRTSWLPADTWMRSTCPSSCFDIAQYPRRCRTPRRMTFRAADADFDRERFPGRTPYVSRRRSQRAAAQRFSTLPPHRSVRVLTNGETNWEISQPCPPWMVTMPKPQFLANSAALANASIVCSIISSVMGRMCRPSISYSTGP